MGLSDQLDLALRLIPPSDWKRFERFASSFLASEFTDLRTTAAASGDGGRDAELFEYQGDPSVVFAYSVTENWKKKVKRDIKRVRSQFPTARLLIYCTNHDVGAKADELKRTARDDHGLHLDVRDRSYFVERCQGSQAHVLVSEELVEQYVAPYVASNEIVASKGRALSDVESKAAFVFLQLQNEDEKVERNLTKVSYEALVRATLREATGPPDGFMLRTDIYLQVAKSVPSTPERVVRDRVDAALKRLERHYLRHWTKDDKFCLTSQEVKRIGGRLAELERRQSDLQQAIRRAVDRSSSDELYLNDLEGIAEALTALIERVLHRQGELFVNAVSTGDAPPIVAAELRDLTVAVLSENPADYKVRDPITLLVEAFKCLLEDDSRAVRQYLASMGETYTLFAFLQETQDVQRAVRKLFSHGDVWLDTSIVLPLLIETLRDDRPLTDLLAAARQVGLRLRVTPGVVEEVESNLRRAVARASRGASAWTGNDPVIYANYVAVGGEAGTIRAWVEQFRGLERPADDIRESLADLFGIEQHDLKAEMAEANVALRAAVREVWNDIHARRRAQQSLDIYSLVEHDVENWLGVLQLRRKEKGAQGLGYRSWWLTLDRQALGVKGKVELRYGHPVGPSPTMSPEFLLAYLNFRPFYDPALRPAVLPPATHLGGLDLIPRELIEVAEEVRAELKGLPSRVVERRVRDAMDRRRRGDDAHEEGSVEELLAGEW